MRAHLEAVAEATEVAAEPSEVQSLGDLAASRIRSVIEAAEGAAGEIQMTAQAESDARREAAEAETEEMLTGARAESERVVSRARAEGEAHVASVQSAVGGLVAQAEELRAQVADLGSRLTAAAPRAEVPGPVTVPEPMPPTIPEPSPDPVPEPTPDPVPEPTPDPPAPDLPDEPGPLEPPVPEPAPEPPAAEETTEDLIAQLRAGSGTAPVANGSGSVDGASGGELGAARLVAMNMALDGASRDDISGQLESEFGDLPDMDGLLDEVLARAER